MGLKNYTLEQLQNIHGFKLLKFRDLSKLGLGKGDFVYIDALSNQVIMGSDEDGFPIELEQDSDGTWHISGSLVVAPKPRLKKLLQQLTPLREASREATLVCGLPLGRYIASKCCRDTFHLDNMTDVDYGQIFVSATAVRKGCLEAAFPGCIIFNPTKSFSDADSDLASLHSSAGIAIWQEKDPVHLTNSAYGDIVASLVRVVTTTASEATADQQCRPRLESVVMRPREATAANTTPGWIVGESQVNGRGRGAFAHGFGASVALEADRLSVEEELAAGCPTRALGKQQPTNIFQQQWQPKKQKIFLK